MGEGRAQGITGACDVGVRDLTATPHHFLEKWVRCGRRVEERCNMSFRVAPFASRRIQWTLASVSHLGRSRRTATSRDIASEACPRRRTPFVAVFRYSPIRTIPDRASNALMARW